MTKPKRSKFSFLILEVLIALSIFGLCIVPMMGIPMLALNAQIKTYQRMQVYRLSDLAFAEVRARLYRQEIALEELPEQKRDKTIVLQGKDVLHLKNLGARTLHHTCSVWSSGHKTGKNQEESHLVNVEVNFTLPSKKKFFLFKSRFRDSISFYYKVFVTQKGMGFEENPVGEKV